MKFIRGLAATGVTVCAACVTYGFVEARRYRLRSHRIPVLPAGVSPLRILQVSDLHLQVSNRQMSCFLESLADDSYDLVFATGDLLGAPGSVERCADLLNRLRGTAGRCFVLGSADYYAPRLKNYLDYFIGRRRPGTRRRTEDFRGLLLADGWNDLTNRTIEVDVNGTRVQLTGLDDPFLSRDDRSLLVRKAGADLAICVVHDPAPYDDASRAGFELTVAGHTHGGQVRFPLIGALVTNSTLPREFARGLTRVNGVWLYVNPGLGTGKFAPFRFLCPPEASILELVERD